MNSQEQPKRALRVFQEASRRIHETPRRAQEGPKRHSRWHLNATNSGRVVTQGAAMERWRNRSQAPESATVPYAVSGVSFPEGSRKREPAKNLWCIV